MNILVVGSGGREHAIIWKLSQDLRTSKIAGKIYCAPGNGGIEKIAECVAIKPLEMDRMVEFALNKKIELVIVGPDDPLAAGIVDIMEQNGIRVFGPSKCAAFIEASKVFSKNLMKKYNIPTASYETFDNSENALSYLKKSNYPIVIKADGLALGKGVFIADNYEQAKNAVIDMLEENKLGESGRNIVIEDFLEGVEVSVLAFTDGTTLIPMTSSKDHKRAYDNDQGANTGGMGTISPNTAYTEEIALVCMRDIFIPTIEAMNKEGRKFKGVLFFGLILTSTGPKLLEYNARFGDPETQVILPRLKTNLLGIINAVIDERLSEITLEWDEKNAICVVAASGGYPQDYETGYEIDGLDEISEENIFVFHAGTRNYNGKLITSGGRVLGVTALAENLYIASQKAYAAMSKICFKDMHFRKDIGKSSGG